MLLEFDLCWLIQFSAMFTIGLQILVLFTVINLLQLIFVRMHSFSLSSIMLNLYAGNETWSGKGGNLMMQSLVRFREHFQALKFVGWGHYHALEVWIFNWPMPGSKLSKHHLHTAVIEHNGHGSQHDHLDLAQSATPLEIQPNAKHVLFKVTLTVICKARIKQTQ